MENAKEKQYIYIVQSSKEPSWCKIGKTNDLERRLKEYNNMTGKSTENIYCYLFACEVGNMTQVENDVKKKFVKLRQDRKKEIYFFSPAMLEDYVDFIKSHQLFVEEIPVETDDKPIVKIVKKTTPSLEDRGITRKDVMQDAQKRKNDEFYTRYEDVEKEISMYDKEIWREKWFFATATTLLMKKTERQMRKGRPLLLCFL
jgi:hypothetical protein